jgi:hypothetical protein
VRWSHKRPPLLTGRAGSTGCGGAGAPKGWVRRGWAHGGGRAVGAGPRLVWCEAWERHGKGRGTAAGPAPPGRGQQSWARGPLMRAPLEAAKGGREANRGEQQKCARAGREIQPWGGPPRPRQLEGQPCGARIPRATASSGAPTAPRAKRGLRPHGHEASARAGDRPSARRPVAARLDASGRRLGLADQLLDELHVGLEGWGTERHRAVPESGLTPWATARHHRRGRRRPHGSMLDRLRKRRRPRALPSGANSVRANWPAPCRRSMATTRALKAP